MYDHVLRPRCDIGFLASVNPRYRSLGWPGREWVRQCPEKDQCGLERFVLESSIISLGL